MSNKQFEKGLSETNLHIKDIGNEEATLVSDELSFSMPRKILPRELVAGDEVVVTISSFEEHQTRKKKKARELLNEILSNNQ